MKRIEYCESCKGNPYYVIKSGQVKKYRCPKCNSYLKDTYVADDEVRKKYIPMSVYLTLTEEQILKRMGAYSQKAENKEAIKTIEPTEKMISQVNVRKQIQVENKKTAQINHERTYQFPKEEMADKVSMPFSTSVDADKAENDEFIDQLNAKRKTNPSYKEEVEEFCDATDMEQEYGKRTIRVNNRSIYGEILSVSSDPGKYERTLTSKLYEKIRYRQRMSDVHNKVKIAVWEEDRNRADCEPVEIIFHGNVEGGIDAFEQGGIIRAHGKMKGDRIFYADSITYDDKTVRIAIERSDAAVVSVPMIVVAMCIFVWQLIPAGMTFFQGIAYLKEQITRFIIWDMILTGIISMLLYIYTRRGVSALLRRLPTVPYSRCFWLGLALSTIISVLIVFG